jgi:DHA1 family bicyclomycin/chloramphenicol resistance-like MFS transporter
MSRRTAVATDTLSDDVAEPHVDAHDAEVHEAEVLHEVNINAGAGMTRKQIASYIVMLGALVALGPFTIDLYLPAFPSVARDLLTTDAAIQLTLTATAIGFGLGQLVVGPLSDSVGRRRPLLVMTSVHVLASIGVALAPTVEWVLVGRVFQGIGAAGSGVVAMAMVRDMFSGQRLIRMLSRLVLIMGFAPVFAPVIGSQLLRVVEWRGVFVVLAFYGLTMLVVAGLFLKETLPASRRGKVSTRIVGVRYRRLLGDPGFVGVSLIGAATFTALFSYLSASSFVLQEQHGLTAQQFGYVFGLNSIGLIASTQISARLMRRMAPSTVTAIGLTIMTTAAVALLASAVMGLGLIAVVVPLVFLVGAAGLVFPTVQVMALADHPAEAGTAAALIGAVNMGVAGAISPLVGVLGNTTLAMAAVMLGALVVGQASLWLVVRKRMSRTVVA